MSAAKRRRASSPNVRDSSAAEAMRILRNALSVSSLVPLLQQQKRQPECCTDGVVTIEEGDELQTASASPQFSHQTPLPTIEQLDPLLRLGRLRAAFLRDVRPSDVICARVVRCGVGVMELEMVCMLTRFRRCLEIFMKGERFNVLFDRTKRAYQMRDHVRSHVTTTDPLALRIDEDEAIVKFDELPAYYREWRVAKDAEQKTYDGEAVIGRMKKNPNLSELLSVRIDDPHFSTLCGLAPGPSARTADDLRREQTFKLAMEHVRRGAELTRQGECFEATQFFNKALNTDESCVDAYVGRGAACAGEKNYKAALADFDRALELDSTHRNARKYRIEVLIAHGRDLEREGSISEARENYQKAADLSNGSDSRALEPLRRLSQQIGKNGMGRLSAGMEMCGSTPAASSAAAYNQVELIDLSGEDEATGGAAGRHGETNGHWRKGIGDDTARPPVEELSKEEAERKRDRLREMEDFIAKLKASK